MSSCVRLRCFLFICCCGGWCALCASWGRVRLPQAAAVQQRDDTIRQQTIAAAEREAVIQGRNAIIAERDGTIAEQAATVAEQAAAIVQRDGAIAEQAATIADQAAAVAQRDTTIAEQAAAAVEKDGTIAGHAATIAALKRTTAELEGLLVGGRVPGGHWRPHLLPAFVTCPRPCAPGPRFVEHAMSCVGGVHGALLCDGRLRKGPSCNSGTKPSAPGTRRWLSVSGSWWGCVWACLLRLSAHAGEGDGWGGVGGLILGWRE